MSLLDRTNISAAYIAGLAEDLELTAGARYNLALLVFFIGTYKSAHAFLSSLTNAQVMAFSNCHPIMSSDALAHAGGSLSSS